MKEVRCRHCGAVFTAHAEGAFCPYCGSESSSGFKIPLRHVAHSLWFGLWILLVFFHGGSGLAADPGLIIVYGALAVGVAIFMLRQHLGRKPGKLQQSPITLDLGANPAILNPSAPPSRMRPPEVPKVWRTLLSTARPREVYLPPAAWLVLFGEGLLALIPFFQYLAYVRQHHVPVDRLLVFRADELGTFWMVLYVVAFALHVKDFFGTREIVRDGEAVVGFSRGDGRTATYQFCTVVGDWFEGRARIVSRRTLEESYATPIFYMPEDPRKNVALFGTQFLVHLPEKVAEHEMQNAPMKP